MAALVASAQVAEAEMALAGMAMAVAVASTPQPWHPLQGTAVGPKDGAGPVAAAWAVAVKALEALAMAEKNSRVDTGPLLLEKMRS